MLRSPLERRLDKGGDGEVVASRNDQLDGCCLWNWDHSDFVGRHDCGRAVSTVNEVERRPVVVIVLEETQAGVRFTAEFGG